MGRINLTPLRVRKRALANLETKRTQLKPSWLDITGDIPPAQILAQINPQTLKTLLPITIRYEEDQLRKQFFSDHPWELARPRVLLETSGDSHAGTDWSTGVRQPGIALSGEAAVQRQLHLLTSVPDITVSQSYDIARKEFYDLRRHQETERRVAAEEARHNGVTFTGDIMGYSLDIEDKHIEDWERWSRQQVVENMQKNAAFEGNIMPSEEDVMGDPAGEQPAAPVGNATFSQEASMAMGRNKGPARGRAVIE